MFSLQVQIRNLTAVQPDKQTQSQQQITIRFGPLQTDIPITSPHFSGGKRLLLQMQASQMQSLISTYAFGLFMINTYGKFWSIISLQKIKINQQYSCNCLSFYDDDRNVWYQYQLSLLLTEYHPRVPQQRAISEKVPIVPAAPPKQKINSFLYGNNKNETIVSSQPPQPPRKKPKAQAIKVMKKQQKVSYAVADNIPQKQIDFDESLDPGVYIPPIMQFTNTGQSEQLQPPSRIPVERYPIAEQTTPNYLPKKQTKAPKLQTFMNYSQFKQHNKKTIKPNDQLTKQELRDLARKQAEQQIMKKQTEIMVPIPNPLTGTYTLVPLSTMSEAQIIEYAQKQQQAEELKKFKEEEQARRKRKQEKKKHKQNIIGKIGKQGKQMLANQNVGLNKKFSKQKISEKNKQSSESSIISDQNEKDLREVDNYKRKNSDHYNSQKRQDENQSENSQDQNYQSDFDSISNVGSQLKSRISLQSSLSASQKQKKKVNESDISESMNDYEYSQDFDSFSQSMLSRNKRGSSISEISGSYTSMSYKKP